ncbi:hypothetical protein ES703_41275 [subsurface metagenome]
MNLQKAIEIKEAYHTTFGGRMLSQERFADRLSIEAMKRFQQFRPVTDHPVLALLPGETKD